MAHETARAITGQVAAWYAAHIIKKRRGGATDEELRDLIERRYICLRDQDNLDYQNEEEVNRVAALYSSVLKGLEGSG
jgi:hypothetical protein